MFDAVSLSQRTMTLVEKLHGSGIEPGWDLSIPLPRTILVHWLNQNFDNYNKKKYHFWLESLRTSLLTDLNHAFLTPAERQTIQPKPKRPWYKSAKFILSIIAGMLIAVCEGFDGIASILGLVASVPTLVLFAVGGVFALCAVMIFCLINLVSISKSMDISLRQSRNLLDLLLEYTQQINDIEQSINKCYLKKPVTAANLQAFRLMLVMMQTRYDALEEARLEYRDRLNGPKLMVAKIGASLLAGAILGASVFFSCQTLSLAIGGLFIAAISATFWPIVLVCTLMSIIAFALFWKIGRPELEAQVAYWSGLDLEQIDAFANQDIVEGNKAKLNLLKEQIDVVEEMLPAQDNPPAPVHRPFPLLKQLEHEPEIGILPSNIKAPAEAVFHN